MSADQAKQLTDQAVQSLRDQDYERAVELAREALELDQRSSDAWSACGIALSRAGRAEEATEALQRAVQTGPYTARNYFNLATHFYGLGQKHDAIAMAQEAIRCEGKHKGAHDLLKRVEAEVHTEAAPYLTSLGDQRGSAYTYKPEKQKDEL